MVPIPSWKNELTWKLQLDPAGLDLEQLLP